MAKLAETAEAVILVSFIVINLERILSQILLFVFVPCRLLWMTFTDVASCLYHWLGYPQRVRAADVQRS
jgi:hypothetical protein